METSKAYAKTQALFMWLRTALEVEKFALYQKGSVTSFITPARSISAKFFRHFYTVWVVNSTEKDIKNH